MMGKRSIPGHGKNVLRRLANAVRKRHEKRVAAGSLPAHMCRLMGEREDDRPLCHPFANLVQ
eukprot:7297486-Pyramimonas_sp.AAC.1